MLFRSPGLGGGVDLARVERRLVLGLGGAAAISGLAARHRRRDQRDAQDAGGDRRVAPSRYT